ncbi:phage-related minor tail protein [Rhodococcus sp. AG1013]|uniref:phage tail tape measure protein n=1 Tax=Rhodococcus sp. AG1013 TaxID=2183996 RepID=UPI000E0A01BB|nr:phage tail tape measure protein [Rhodococcus sp. AG1013]RDI13445.1 phage-related minor tail protein [Rhodococcus sp. AG1013]
MATSIGWASVQIVPVISGIASQVSSQLQGPMGQAGQQAGQELGNGIADGLAKAEAAVKTASRKIEQARASEMSAAAKLNIEELKLQELRDKGGAKTSQLAAAEERVRQAREKHNQTVGASEAALKQLERAQERVTQATEEAGDSAQQASHQLVGFSNSVEDMGSGVDNGIDQLKNFAIAAAGIGGAVELGMQALDNLNIESRLGAQLGATPELAKEYGDAAGTLYKQGLSGSMEDAADAIAAVASTFEVAGSEGEKSIDQIAAAAVTFSDTFGTDVAESVQMADQLITNGLAANSTEAFDLMAAGWTRTDLAMREELPDLMNEYGQFFASMGMNGEQAFGLLVNAADGGKIQMDKVGDAIKELSIKATDLGDTGAQDALKELGLAGDETANALLQGGDAANKAFNDIVNGLNGMDDPAGQAAAAVALFGTPLEDLGKDQIPGFLDGMASAGEAMDGFEGTSQRLGEQINSGPGYELEKLKNTIQGGLTDALGDMATWVMNNTDTLKTLALVAAPFFGALAGYAATVKIIQIATVAWNTAQMLLNGTMMLNPVGLIIAAIAGLVAAVVLIATKTTWFQDLWGAVWGAVTAAWDWAWGVLSSGFEMLKGAFGAVGDKVGDVKDWIVGKWNDVVGFVTGLPGKISSAASGMWDGIKNAFKGAINWIIQAWNAIEFRIPGFEVGPIKWDGFTLGLPDLPMLAQGGPITGGTPGKDSVLAMLMPGEHVLDTGDVSALGGQEGVYRLRAALDMGDVPRFAEGGAVVSPDQLATFAKGVEGKPYVWGGVNWGDCSGAVSALANFATGRDPFGSRFATMTEGTELAARGFKSGLGPAGSLNVGWFNGGPYGGHTAATLPNGVNFEMGGGRGNGQYGGPAAGANDSQFTDHAHLPMVVAQLVQPNVQQLDPLTGFPTDGGAPMMPVVPSPDGATTQQPEQAFSGRERIRKMGSDIGGIWADSAVEIFGVGEWLDLADRYTITPEAGAGAVAPSSGENGVDGDPNIIPWIADMNAFFKGTGLFDTGGVWEPGTFGFNGLKTPELVLKPEQWDVADRALDTVQELATVGGGGPRVQIINNNNQTIADQDSWQRDQAVQQNIALMRFGR